MACQSKWFLWWLSMCLGLALITAQAGHAEAFTIVHTNDLHSHFLGVGPNIDYTPFVTGDDATVGGISRIATVIKGVRKEAGEAVVVLDGGDFMMGSLFHMVAPEEGFELRILKECGYDVLTLGNHEFDLKPEGLARILRSAAKMGGAPQIVAANTVFDPDDTADDSLEDVFQNGLVKPFTIISRAGVKIGIFGLLGEDASDVAPFAAPLTFADPIQTAQAMVDILKSEHRVDLVICLSHSGLDSSEKKAGEDVRLAKNVDGIDVIISAHTHTLLREPMIVEDTIIVQAGAYGRHVGVLKLSLDDTVSHFQAYEQIEINDSIAGDRHIQTMVDEARELISLTVLNAKGFTFDQIIAQTRFDLTLKEADSNLGNLVADSIRWSIDSYQQGSAEGPKERTDVAFESNGVIRDNIFKGKTGMLAVCDLFRVVPLGVGMMDETPGYPLVSIYLYPHEIKKALEVLTSVYPMKGSDYFLQVSGLKFRYNPNRVIFDRVVDIYLGDDAQGYEKLDTSRSNTTLYKVGGNIYNTTFLKLIGDFTWGILTIVPKDKNGDPINDLRDAIVDTDPETAGIQELKQWEAFLAFAGSFEDIDSNGIPDIPLVYQIPQARIIQETSWNPVMFFKNATYPTWLATLGGVILLTGVLVLAL